VIRASTVAEAQVLAAILQGEGIPAYVEGALLADEFATSRRLVNAIGARVLVPADCAARAQEILAAEKPTDDELAAQALAAESAESPPLPTTPPRQRPRPSPRLVIVGWLLLPLVLWLLVWITGS
jgi:Putative prokaryotic signal transducing protein